jgi:hypothetical protein
VGLLKWAAATCTLAIIATSIQAQEAKPQPSLSKSVKQDEAKPVKAELPVSPMPKTAQDANKTVLATKESPIQIKQDALPPKNPQKQLLPSKTSYESYPVQETKSEYRPYLPPVVPKLFDVIASADGKTLHAVGRIGASSATVLKAAIQNNVKVKTVSLSSEGGALVEGLAMAHIIREFDLDTYVELHCSSACTFAFLAGKNRVISSNAKIGFHQSSLPYSVYNASKKDARLDGGDLMIRNVYTRANIDPAIIDQGLKTPATDIWFPPTQMLLNGNVVTRLVKKDEGRTAVGKWPSSDKFIEQINLDPILQDILTLRPQIYYRAAGVVWNDEALGKKSNNQEEKMKATAIRLLLADLDQYPDDIVDAYIQLENEMWKTGTYKYSLDCSYGVTYQAPVIAEIEEKYVVRYRALLKSMAAIEVKPIENNDATNAITQANLIEFYGLIIANNTYDAYNVMRDFCSAPSVYFSQLTKLPRAERLSYIRAALLSTKVAISPIY